MSKSGIKVKWFATNFSMAFYGCFIGSSNQVQVKY